MIPIPPIAPNMQDPPHGTFGWMGYWTVNLAYLPDWNVTAALLIGGALIVGGSVRLMSLWRGDLRV